MSKTIDNLTGTESLDELEAMLAEIEQAPDVELDNGTDTKQTDVEHAPSAGEVAAGNEQAAANQVEEQANAPEKVILAKNGQHTIPYEVLEQSRNETKQLREQLAQAQQAQAERDKLQALLEKNGIDPSVDPDNISKEELEQLAQDYPDIGKALMAVASKLDKLEPQAAPQQVQPVANPVQAALQAVPDLAAWRDGDQDRFDMALTIDDKLQADPAWSNKPLAERFAEVARRTKLAFGDEVEAPPAKASGKAAEKPADHIPSSPSELGQTHHAPATGVERYGAMSQADLIGEMGSMTEAQIEALLAQSGF
ncbi:hypothetical protein E4630_16180 [Aeromonas hydrophila]|uniref:hypothetical protein n=1 Tax=Aeromonas hydrophila TaxID=644 RepID=UPI000FD188CB|nr:hypothetical protein [Aeromonas hydrophila]AZU47951.1 hypothetical protein C3B79_2180 [Aeromonas hydrophila]QBX71430.1 hypothetical protein E4625_11680 [Aeromonas hydrophila]QBX72259.1 hypothetical protein E4625_16405 [Aeromonas hydrophila]QBX76129.1 hypothetical protein E4630_11460 [Aeromonas hydrophila]QBX76959.1 hypothetical protein E4630_16180 [Aeromonas hydrophila]